MSLPAVGDRLSRLDARAARAVPQWRTLDPTRSRASSFAQLGQALLSPDDGSLLMEAFADGLACIFDAQLRSFPDNLLWDYDYLAACLLQTARAQGKARADALWRHCELVAALQALFGRGSPIHFAYVHDFVYGFDWARWVQRAPSERSGIGPFDWAFLEHTHRRGHELLALIERDDAEYPPLTGGQPRNPFPFSRRPAHELRLHGDLAQRDLIPVRAWRHDASPRWDRPYTELREQRAKALGLDT